MHLKRPGDGLDIPPCIRLPAAEHGDSDAHPALRVLNLPQFTRGALPNRQREMVCRGRRAADSHDDHTVRNAAGSSGEWPEKPIEMMLFLSRTEKLQFHGLYNRSSPSL